MKEEIKKEIIDIFLEKLILLDKINRPKIEYLKGYMDAKINEKEEKNYFSSFLLSDINASNIIFIFF